MRTFLIVFVLLFVVTGTALFAQATPTDEQIRHHARELGVPFEALKDFVVSHQARASLPDVIIIDGVRLLDEYRANSIRADSIYLGRTLKVTAPIARFATGWDGRPRIDFIRSLAGGLEVSFDPSEAASIANLSIGQTVTFIATVDRWFVNTLVMSNGFWVEN